MSRICVTANFASNQTTQMSSCVLQTSKKYRERPGPPYKGNDCCGEMRPGNDGLPYVSEQRGKATYCKWFPLDDDTSTRSSSTIVGRKPVAKRGRAAVGAVSKPSSGVKRARTARSRSRSRGRATKKAAVSKSRSRSRSRSQDRGVTWNEFRSQYKGQGYTMAQLSAMYKSGAAAPAKKAPSDKRGASPTTKKSTAQFYAYEFTFPFEHSITAAAAKIIAKELNSGENDLRYIDDRALAKNAQVKHLVNKTGVTTVITFPKDFVAEITKPGNDLVAEKLYDYLKAQFHDGWGSQGFQYGKREEDHVFVQYGAPVKMVGRPV